MKFGKVLTIAIICYAAFWFSSILFRSEFDLQARDSFLDFISVVLFSGVLYCTWATIEIFDLDLLLGNGLSHTLAIAACFIINDAVLKLLLGVAKYATCPTVGLELCHVDHIRVFRRILFAEVLGIYLAGFLVKSYVEYFFRQFWGRREVLTVQQLFDFQGDGCLLIL